MRIQVLGPVRAWRDNIPVDLGPVGRRAVLGLLALAGGQPLSRAEMVDALWAEQPPSSAVNILQTQVKHLRRALEPDRRRYTPSGALPTVGDGYALAVPAEQVDLRRFRQLVAAAAMCERDGQPARAAPLLDEAARLWHGAALADVPQLATHPKVIALAEERRAALARLGAALLATGAAAQALPTLREVVAERQLDEAAWAALIRCYHAAGRRADAFTTYHEVRRRLADELGVDPGPELIAVHTALLNQDAPQPDQDAPQPGRNSLTPGQNGPVPAQLPPDIAGFAGRSSYLRQLDRLLPSPGSDRPGAVIITTIHGAAGVGKSALAVHWAHRVANRFPDGQLYLNLRGFDPSGPPVSAAEAVRIFLDTLGVAPQRVPVSLPAQAGLYRSLLAHRRTLVLLDNAHDAEQVRPLLPGSPGCLALVTSRNQLSGLVAEVGAVPLSLELPAADEARMMLVGRLGAERVRAEPEAVDALIARCARLPLALAVLAARAAGRPGFSLAALVSELTEARCALDPFAGDDTATDIRAVFSWSYRALSAPAARLFRLLSQHPGAELGRHAAASIAGVPAMLAHRLLDELDRARLVAQRSPGRFTMHDLLRGYATELAAGVDSERERRSAQHRALDHYVHTGRMAAALLTPGQDLASPDEPPPGVSVCPPSDHAQALAWFTAEHSVLLAAVRAGSDPHARALGQVLAEVLDRHGHWPALAEVQAAALAAAQRLADQDGQARAHRGLARAHARLDRHEDAQLHLRHALRLYGERGDLSGQAGTHIGLAWVAGARQRPADALRHAEQALQLFTEAGNNTGRANGLNTAGWFHGQLGDQRRTVLYCRQALALYWELDDRPGQADTWDTLGYAYHRLGQHREAVDSYRHALDLYRELGAGYNEADTLGRLGDTYRAGGALTDAAGVWHRAIEILEELGHPAVDEVRRRLHALHASAAASGRTPGGAYPNAAVVGNSVHDRRSKRPAL